MPSLYKKPIVRTHAKTGEKIKSHSRKWWGQFRDGNGKLRRHPLCADKAAAQAMLRRIVSLCGCGGGLPWHVPSSANRP